MADKQADRVDDRSGWNRTESKIALISVVISALGVIFAAVSSFASWQQLELIGRERMTPYKTVMFSARLDSYQQMVSDSSAFVGQSRSIMYRANGDWKISATDEQISEMRDENDSSFEKMKASYQIGLSIWPDDTTETLRTALDAAERMHTCNSGTVASDVKDGISRFAKLAVCSGDLLGQNDDLKKHVDNANKAMAKHIRQYQVEANPRPF